MDQNTMKEKQRKYMERTADFLGRNDLFEVVVKLYSWRKWGYSSLSFGRDYAISQSIEQSEYIFIGCITLQMNCRAGQSQLDV